MKKKAAVRLTTNSSIIIASVTACGARYGPPQEAALMRPTYPLPSGMAVVCVYYEATINTAVPHGALNGRVRDWECAEAARVTE